MRLLSVGGGGSVSGDGGCYGVSGGAGGGIGGDGGVGDGGWRTVEERSEASEFLLPLGTAEGTKKTPKKRCRLQ